MSKQFPIGYLMEYSRGRDTLKHIRGVRLHFLPESTDGSQPLYADITFEKEKQ